jgi:hypothetical protein
MEKRCFRCLEVKPIDEFYRHAMMGDGHLNKCKECTKSDVTAHRLANIERVRAYDKSRASMPHRLAARKEYAQTPAGKAAHRRALQASALKYPEKRDARIAFGNAVRDGRVIPWPVCAVPECDRSPQGHHFDYSRPLEVVWLCEAHHREAHRITEQEAA